MYTPTTLSDDNTLYIYALAILIIILQYLGIPKKIYYFFNHSPSTSLDISLIMAYYTNGLDLMQLSRGKTNGLRYSLYTTIKAKFDSENPVFIDAGSLIYVLQLPFNTQAHIVGISKKYNVNRGFLTSFLDANGVENTPLEGDFVNKCNIYSQIGQGSITQYVLDPKAMQFIIDFCADNFWEIAGDELILVKTENQKGGGNLLDISSRFVQEIRPAIEQKGEPVKHKAPYGVYEGDPLPCPICKAPMTVKTNWLECPNSHGILINGRYVIEIREKRLKAEELIACAIEHGEIICPNCGSTMNKVNYQSTGVMIDSCSECPFRWLDTNEASKIITKL